MPNLEREYRSPDFLADVKDLLSTTADSLANVDWKAKGKALLGFGNRPVREAFDQTIKPITEAVSGFLRGVSEEQQKNYRLMGEMDSSTGITEEQLEATIAEVINVATITKPVAVKQLSTAFKERKAWIAGMLDASGRIESPRLRESAGLEKAQLERNFPIITKAIRRQPQELLDPINEVGLSVRSGARGQLNPTSLRADWSVEKGVNITSASVPHEALHALDVKKYRDTIGWTEDLTRRVPPMGYFEARAYPFGDKMEKAMAELPRGEKVSKETYDAILTQVEKEIVDRWGPNSFDYDMKKVLEHEFGKRAEDSVEEELKAFAKTNNVNFQGRWEDMKGWLLTDNETKSSALVKSREEAEKAIAKMRGGGKNLYELDSPKPGFFSKLEESAMGLKNFGKTDAGQIRSMLKNKGVSPAEVDNVLGGVEGKLDKDALLGEIAANKTKFEDVVFGENQVSNVRNFREFLERYREENPTQNHTYPELQEMFIQESSMKEMKNTKFSQFQEPGAVEGSYRELVVTAPETKRLAGPTKAVEQYKEGILTIEEAERLGVHVPETFDWRDGHSVYNEIENPIVRLRYNDRITPEGKKILFIEEMQGPTGNTKWQILPKEELSKKPGETYTFHGSFDTKAEAENYIKISGRTNIDVKKYVEGEQGKMPPYLQSRIYDIGVKKALILAKEGGYAGVAWTPGKMQVKRYEDAITKTINRLEWEAVPDGSKVLYMNPANGGSAIKTTFNSKGIAVSSDHPAFVGNHIDKIVSDQTGTKIMNEKTGTIRGINIKVGGEGLKRVYDKTLPEKFKQYGKGELSENYMKGKKPAHIMDGGDYISNTGESFITVKKEINDYGDRIWAAYVKDIQSNSLIEKMESAHKYELQEMLDRNFGLSEPDKVKVSFFRLNKNTPERFPTYAVLPPAALALNELMKVLPPSTPSEEY